MRHDKQDIAELIASQKPGFALDQRFYTDPDIFALEIERIVTQDWILAGHESELPAAGDFKVINVANESAIVVRGSNGELHAFANVCRHRGSLVCLEGHGNTRKFTCPYHGWMYDIDGNLVAARNMPDGFDKAGSGLNRLPVDTLHGLVMMSFCDDPPSLAGARRDLAEPMALFDFEHLKVAAYREYEIPANWKLSIENYVECYHCATAHPDYAKMHTLMLDNEKRERTQGRMLERMEACGMRDMLIDYMDNNARPGEMGYAYSRTALFEGYKTGGKEGAAVAPLLGGLKDYDGGASDFALGPFSFMLAYSDHVVCYVFTPVDITNSRCAVYWLVRDDAAEGRDYDVDELTWLWDVTTKADKTIIANNARGIQSRFYRPGPFSEMEYCERSYVEWYLSVLAD